MELITPSGKQESIPLKTPLENGVFLFLQLLASYNVVVKLQAIGRYVYKIYN